MNILGGKQQQCIGGWEKGVMDITSQNFFIMISLNFLEFFVKHF